MTFCALAALRLAGAVGYPADGDLTVQQLHNFDWANLLYFEPWFAIMGVLLIGCSRYARRVRSVSADAAAPRGSTGRRRIGTALTLAGLLVVLWGVFTFDIWTFAGYGPALMAAGLLTLATGRERVR